MAQLSLVDSIYEAALVPELWEDALDALGHASGSASGSLLVFDGQRPPRWRTRERTRGVLDQFSRTDAWRRNERHPERLTEFGVGDASFHYADDLMTPEQLAKDSVIGFLKEVGLGWQLGTALKMPTDEYVVFTFERAIEDGRHDAHEMARLMQARPHLARAGLLAARLGLARVRGALDAMTAIGLPAALVSRRGRLLEMNAMMDGHLVLLADGRFCFGDPHGDALLKQRLADENAIASIPLRATDQWPGRVTHLVPVSGAARDVFSGGMLLLLINTAHAALEGPDLTILRALFDLTPAEAGLAAKLATGADLKTAASSRSIRFSTARSYLENIFLKTGCRRQTELVALLVGLTAGPSHSSRPTNVTP